MKVTKYEHACLVIEVGGKNLVIDPGAYTTPLVDVGGVVAIVITHEHPDHWTPEQLTRILERSPDARIFGTQAVVDSAKDFDVELSSEGRREQIDPFTIEFFGEKHAVIHESIPVIDNVGVLVNDTLFYPGDAYTVPPVPVDTLAVPSGAPWLKISEAMDYASAVAPKRAFPVHEMTLSTIGKGLANARLETAVTQAGGEFIVLEPLESLAL